MRLLFFLLIFFITISCSKNKITYWCGDHPCINKSEKETYFKKTMIVEAREFNKNKIKEDSEIDKILQQAQIKEKSKIKKEKTLYKQTKLEKKRKNQEKKSLIKQAKLQEKRRIKEEKALAKRERLEKKRRIKEEKTLIKQIKKDEKKVTKKVKKISKKNNNVDDDLSNSSISSGNFQKIVKEINRRNIFKPYPDINDIRD